MRKRKSRKSSKEDCTNKQIGGFPTRAIHMENKRGILFTIKN